MTNRSNHLRRTTLPAILLAIALMAAACSDGGDGVGIASDIDTDASTATTAADNGDDDGDPDADGATTSSTDGDDSTTSTTADDESTTSTTTSTDLPGEPWDGFAQPGDTLSVFGVEADDELNIRSIPGTDGEIVGTAAPTADDLVATGQARMLPRSFWYEVTHGGVTGWVSVAFVAYEGGTDDATAEYLESRDRPAAETLLDLGLFVSEAFASDEPPSDIVASVAPTVGDVGEVTYDVVGIGDDAGAGYRIHVFAVETESGEGWELRTIERTSFCTRGVTGELCN